MKHPVNGLLFLGCLFLALGGCATEPRTETAEDSTQATRHCIRDTGTRVEVPEGRCVNAPGRVYTNEDLERSGGMSVGDALRRIGL